MKPRPIENLVIGRDYRATRALAVAIHNRKIRDMHRAIRRARYRAALDRIRKTLTFWKA